MRYAFRYLVVIALTVLTALAMASRGGVKTPLPNPLDTFPDAIGEWQTMRSIQFDQQTLATLRPTEYLAKRYQRQDKETIELYIGYHDGAAAAGPLHSPKNCLPGSGWYEASSRPIALELGTTTLHAVLAEYRLGGQAELFLYWFEVGGESVSNDYLFKIHCIYHALRTGRQDSSFIRLSQPVQESVAKTAETLIAFVRQAYPLLRQYLPS